MYVPIQESRAETAHFNMITRKALDAVPSTYLGYRPSLKSEVDHENHLREAGPAVIEVLS